jgi:hypothetical protein
MRAIPNTTKQHTPNFQNRAFSDTHKYSHLLQNRFLSVLVGQDVVDRI